MSNKVARTPANVRPRRRLADDVDDDEREEADEEHCRRRMRFLHLVSLNQQLFCHQVQESGKPKRDDAAQPRTG